MGIKASSYSPTPPISAPAWITPICFSMLYENKGVSCWGQETPGNGIDTLPQLLQDKGSPSTLVPGKVVAGPIGHCGFYLWQEIYAGPSSKARQAQACWNSNYENIFCFVLDIISFSLNQTLYMLFVFINCPKPWDGPIGITLQAPAPLLAQVLLISPAQICKPDWQQLLQEAPSPLGNKGKQSEPLGIIAVIWILCFFTLQRTSWTHLFISKC